MLDPVSLMTRTIEIIRLTPETYDTPSTETSTSVLGEIQQTARTDDPTLHSIQDQTWTLFLPPGTDIQSDDQIRAEGITETFEVVGPPWPARHPTLGTVSHIEATIRQAG